MNPLHAELISLGFSGYARFHDRALPILPSQVQVNHNTIRSTGAYSTHPAVASGPLAVKNRSSLTATINTPVSPTSAPLIRDLTWAWRQNTTLQDYVSEVPFRVIIGAEEGYEGTGYVDSLTLNGAPNALTTIGIELTAWTYNETSDPTPILTKDQRALLPASDDHKPIPQWATKPHFTGIHPDTTPLAWSLTFRNNWTYQPLLEGALSPPNPRLVYPGPLETILQISWLGRRGDRPQSSGALDLKLGVDPELLRVRLDQLILDPATAVQGTGSANTPIAYAATYYASECIPY